jgi:hypothetical protein
LFGVHFENVTRSGGAHQFCHERLFLKGGESKVTTLYVEARIVGRRAFAAPPLPYQQRLMPRHAAAGHARSEADSSRAQ